ncbi:hypothetical protein RND71_019626 [Anisodus tanguticus]|uniref:TF-B3 domain-containing protein n=1 Tax=Anisodus tanguticus TaxID=243964 RepID=A0AAE1RXQ8_9SOLA|nr:hypothetical protein RND71_019626 [Anisodus tanguticus]
MLNPVYLEVPSGEVWEVEVEHSQGQIWLAEGWQDFSDYYSISCGNFLMFGYNARSHFNVTIFDMSAAEIEYPTAEIESGDSIDISDVVEHSSIPLKFARKYYMQSRDNLVFRVPGRGSWSVKCTLLRRDAKITCGWKAFVLDNKLKLGDVCVLEVIND